ncbi:MAG: hemolytic protein HlpA-like protein [Rhodopirellula sp.]|nr:hemolytic protein HlpA-like protein [Rhodopirellula sp.]
MGRIVSRSLLKTPVAMFIFNRPDVTARVFAEVRRAQPRQLFLVSDGARSERPDEQHKVSLTRELVTDVDWDCDVKTLFADQNMGCKARVSSGLAWVFEQVEDAIILEDDCLPHPSFFGYCQELLDRYRDDERIGAISGNNFQDGTSRTPYSYYFSKYFHCWGWASWRRTWENFDLDFETWPSFRDQGGLSTVADSPTESWYWQRLFDEQYSGNTKVSSWAYPWLYSAWAQNALTILPDVNLISNIGFSGGGTHCTDPDSKFADMEVHDIGALEHPEMIFRSVAADRFSFGRNYYRDSISRRARRICQQIFVGAGSAVT